MGIKKKHSNNPWEVHMHMVKKVNEYLQRLKINPMQSALWDYLHEIIWHRGKDPVRWVDGNRELIKKIAAYKFHIQVPEEIKQQINKSLQELEKY